MRQAGEEGHHTLASQGQGLPIVPFVTFLSVDRPAKIGFSIPPNNFKEFLHRAEHHGFLLLTNKIRVVSDVPWCLEAAFQWASFDPRQVRRYN
jgi:hypothetical protein